jgi:hypothetical protein
MSLIIVVGYDGPGTSAHPSAVYTGRKSAEAEAAMAASTAVRFEIVRNPVVLRKWGRRVPAPVVAVEPPPAPVVAVEPPPAPVEPLPISDPMPDPAAIEPAEADTPSEDPDPDSAAPAGISGKRRK